MEGPAGSEIQAATRGPADGLPPRWVTSRVPPASIHGKIVTTTLPAKGAVWEIPAHQNIVIWLDPDHPPCPRCLPARLGVHSTSVPTPEPDLPPIAKTLKWPVFTTSGLPPVPGRPARHKISQRRTSLYSSQGPGFSNSFRRDAPNPRGSLGTATVTAAQPLLWYGLVDGQVTSPYASGQRYSSQDGGQRPPGFAP